jgi:hypothetical protein
LAAALLIALGMTALVAYREFSPAANGCRAGSERMQRVELLFGMGRKDGGQISEADWRAFLEAEVTPRFPDGLTVLSGYGQWRNSAGVVSKEDSRVLLIWSKPDDTSSKKFESIREAWKTVFAQESVMRADDTSCVSF